MRKLSTLKKKFRQSERGNVLFLILIAVALFAALSYAVTSSSRSGGGNANDEANLVNSASLTQYPASVRTSIIRMVVGGIAVQDLLFDDPSQFGTATNGIDSPALEQRAVFHPNGGGATYVRAPAEVMENGQQGTWFFSSAYEIANIGTSEIGAATSNSSNDIIAFLPGIKESICEKINAELGITGGTDADTDGVPAGPTTVPATNQEMPAASAVIAAAAAATTHEISGVFASNAYGCYDAVDGTAGGPFVYYHVLVER